MRKKRPEKIKGSMQRVQIGADKAGKRVTCLTWTKQQARLGEVSNEVIVSKNSLLD